jgi:hypothetical protein
VKKIKKEEEMDTVKEDSKSEVKEWFKTEEGDRIPLQQEAENDLSSNKEEVCKVEKGLDSSQEAEEVIKDDENGLSFNHKECRNTSKVANGVSASQEPGCDAIKADNGLPSNGDVPHLDKADNGLSSNQEPFSDAIKADNGLPSNVDVPDLDKANNGLSSNQEPISEAIKADNGLPSNGDMPDLDKVDNGLSSNQEPGCDAIKADNGLPFNLDVPDLEKADNDLSSNHEVSGADHQG